MQATDAFRMAMWIRGKKLSLVCADRHFSLSIEMFGTQCQFEVEKVLCGGGNGRHMQYIKEVLGVRPSETSMNLVGEQ